MFSGKWWMIIKIYLKRLSNLNYQIFVACIILACAPPVGSYDPQQVEKIPSALIDTSERFKEPKRK